MNHTSGTIPFIDKSRRDVIESDRFLKICVTSKSKWLP